MFCITAIMVPSGSQEIQTISNKDWISKYCKMGSMSWTFIVL